MLNNKIQKVAEVSTKLNLLIYSPRIKLLGLYLYENNTCTKCQNCPFQYMARASIKRATPFFWCHRTKQQITKAAESNLVTINRVLMRF